MYIRLIGISRASPSQGMVMDAVVLWVVVPEGVVTVIMSSADASIRYPGGINVLNP